MIAEKVKEMDTSLYTSYDQLSSRLNINLVSVMVSSI